ncbi:hypothetical protein EYW47_01495 [Paraburkholderia silviterrae]|uniref:Uncharacterized protein n=1 Tax=Paraburkholderia silviterrae TaxID=2528715 RepID=A0A4R5MFM5_9BURK|nr:hypothetical protein EYW47_01495 [Paraburkholderia silviterrae]
MVLLKVPGSRAGRNATGRTARHARLGSLFVEQSVQRRGVVLGFANVTDAGEAGRLARTLHARLQS